MRKRSRRGKRGRPFCKAKQVWVMLKDNGVFQDERYTIWFIKQFEHVFLITIFNKKSFLTEMEKNLANLHLGYPPTQSMQAPLLTSQLPDQTTAPSNSTGASLIPEQLLQAVSTVQSIDHPGHGTPSFPAPLMATSSDPTPVIIPKLNPLSGAVPPGSSSNTITATPVPLQTDITQGATPASLTELASVSLAPTSTVVEGAPSDGSISLT